MTRVDTKLQKKTYFSFIKCSHWIVNIINSSPRRQPPQRRHMHQCRARFRAEWAQDWKGRGSRHHGRFIRHGRASALTSRCRHSTGVAALPAGTYSNMCTWPRQHAVQHFVRNGHATHSQSGRLSKPSAKACAQLSSLKGAACALVSSRCFHS